MTKVILTALLAMLLATDLDAASWTEGFEGMAAGQAPPGWEVFGAAQKEGWTVQVTAESSAVAQHCLQFSPTGANGNRGRAAFGGSVSYAFDAAPFRGKTMRLAAQLRHRRYKEANGWAQIRLQALRTGGVVLAHQNSADHPVVTSKWTRCVIALAVPQNADSLSFGLNVSGAGTAWLDDIQLEECAIDLARWNAPAAKLSDREVDNLVALARLYGYVRFFHPSDEAQRTNWSDFLLAAVDRVTPAANAAELRARLQEVFVPIAPSLELQAAAFTGSFDAKRIFPPKGSKNAYVVWKHIGYGVDEARHPVYSNRRIESKGLVSRLDEDLREAPKPGAVTEGELAKDVHFRLPLVLYTQEDGTTWPKANGSPPRLDTPEEWGANPLDRRTRLAGVIVAWNPFQHFFPYFDVVKVDWQQALREALADAAVAEDRAAYLATLRRFAAKSHDGHVWVSYGFDDRPYLLPLDWDWAEGRLVVTRDAEGGSDGPRRGDVVESLQDRKVEDWVAELRPQIAAASDGWMRSRLLGQLMRWPTPEPVRIGLRDPSGKTRTVQLSPRPIVDARKRPREARPANGTEVADGVVYFNLDGTEEADLDAALPKMEAARGLVLDLRGYPGRAGYLILEHLANDLMTSAYWNVPHLFQADRRDMTFVTGGRWKMQVRKPHLPAGGGKVAFVTDGSAISYAESCMGIVEAYRLGGIVGEPTAGTNGNITSIRLPGGFRISFTGMQVLKHDGTPHHGVGIHPTVPASRTVRGIATGHDELLEKAIEVVRQP